MDLVGRDKQLAAIERAIQDVRGGATRVLAVVGEPGIGKTALLEATAERTRAAGLLALEGRAAEHERDVPFALAVAALDDHVATLHPRRVESIGPSLGAVLPAAATDHPRPAAAAAAAPERFLYHRALRALIELLARERPLTLLLDDLHWADDASVELVLHLLRRRPRAPHLLVLALRPAQPAGRLLQAAAAGPGTELVELDPLTHDASLAMVAGVPDPVVRERVVREARGNPLFLAQLARFAKLPDGTLPPCLLAGVALEVAALPAGARALIEGAALAGDPFDLELAAVAAELEPGEVGAPLDALVAADLVRPSGHGRAFAFRHPLVRRAVYDAAPPAWRLAAHERVAAALAGRGAGAGTRAHHVERFARPGDEASIALLAAAAAAATETAPATAARWYRVAARMVPESDTQRRAALLSAMALALAAAGRLEEGRNALLEVLAMLPPEPTAERLELVAACAGMEKLLGRPTEARWRLLAAHASTPPERRGALALELAAVASCFGDGRVMRDWAERARLETPASELATLAAAEGIGALGALWEHDPDAAHAAYERAAERLRELDDSELSARLEATVHVAMAELMTERFAEAAATAARGLAIARRTRQGQLLVTLSCIAAMAHYHRLELAAAQRELENAAESARLLDVPHVGQAVLVVRLQIHALRGDSAEAAEAADEWARLLPAVEDGILTRVGRCVTAAFHAERDPERGIQGLGPLLENADVTLATSLLLVLVRAALALGRIEDADRWARRCTAHAAALRLPAGAVRAACARAEVLLARGEAEQAAAVALGAVADAERAGARRDEAVAQLLAGRALAASGDAERAKRVLRRVAADAQRAGALALVGEAARELRRLGSRIPALRPAAAERADHDSLSERERGVAELVIQGRSNKQVAAELWLSEKTIESTLTRVYAKVGVRSRVELTRRLARI